MDTVMDIIHSATSIPLLHACKYKVSFTIRYKKNFNWLSKSLSTLMSCIKTKSEKYEKL